VVSNHGAFTPSEWEKSHWAENRIYTGQGDSWMGLDDRIIQELATYFFKEDSDFLKCISY